jgi:hypothetical protein
MNDHLCDTRCTKRLLSNPAQFRLQEFPITSTDRGTAIFGSPDFAKAKFPITLKFDPGRNAIRRSFAPKKHFASRLTINGAFDAPERRCTECRCADAPHDRSLRKGDCRE